GGRDRVLCSVSVDDRLRCERRPGGGTRGGPAPPGDPCLAGTGAGGGALARTLFRQIRRARRIRQLRPHQDRRGNAPGPRHGRGSRFPWDGSRRRARGARVAAPRGFRSPARSLPLRLSRACAPGPVLAPSARPRRGRRPARAIPPCRQALMKANPEALLLEDDPETLEELRSHFARKRFYPLAAPRAT